MYTVSVVDAFTGYSHTSDIDARTAAEAEQLNERYLAAVLGLQGPFTVMYTIRRTS